MLVPHSDVVEGPQPLVEGPQPMEGCSLNTPNWCLFLRTCTDVLY